MSALRIAGEISESIVDGPGIRHVIFTQGCPHKCKGCHNPQTHSFDGGYLVEVDDLVESILRHRYFIDGVTLSGGEPFAQAEVCLELVRKLKSYGIHVMGYTGYTIEWLMKYGSQAQRELLELLDILVDGPFIKSQKSYDLLYRGSRNQRIIDVKETLRKGEVTEVVYEEEYKLEVANVI